MSENNEPIFSVLTGKLPASFTLSNFPAPGCDMENYYNYAGCANCFCSTVGSIFQAGDPNGAYVYTADSGEGNFPLPGPGYIKGEWLFIHNLDYYCNGGSSEEKWLLVKTGCDSGVLATASGTQGSFPTSGWSLAGISNNSDALDIYRNCVGCDANYPASLSLTFA